MPTSARRSKSIFGVLEVDVEQPVLEFLEGPQVIDLLPEQVRGIEVQAEALEGMDANIRRQTAGQ